ncbi:MAG TPA: hypothetical protein VH186_37735 [Chloroflexia bacterium]|nr:hypothetical protein [Chloroflexia bacterium]
MKFVIIGGGCYGIYHSNQLYKATQKGKLPPDCRFIVVDRNAEPPIKEKFGAAPAFEFVQSDWHEFLMSFMSDPAQFEPERDGEQVLIVPPPYAPHLFFNWLRFATIEWLRETGHAEVEQEREGVEFKMHTPYEFIDPKNGNHFLSRAGWTCPATCIEPHICPAVKDVRDWDLDTDLRTFVKGQPLQPSQSAAAQLAAKGLSNGGAVATVAQDVPPAGYFDGIETFTCHHYMHGIGAIPAMRLYEARQRMAQLALRLTPDRPVARVAVGTVSHCHGVVATIAFKRI